MAELKIPAELKFLGGPLGDGDPKSKCKEVSRTKMQLKIPVEVRFWGGPLGDKDPKSKCKEVSRN